MREPCCGECTFYVQSNLNAIESNKIQAACEGLDIPVVLFKVIPFMDRMPRLSAVEPFVLIGSTTLNRNAFKSRKYRSGVFFNDNFTPEKYKRHWWTNFLNCDMQVFPLKSIPDNLYRCDSEVFFRSNDDSKNISGGTGPFYGLLCIKNNTEAHYLNGDLFHPDSEICIAPLKTIYAEYRVLFCDGEIIGSSRYRPSVHYSVPIDVLEYAKFMQEIWQPHDVFVMDIGETDRGLKIVECNCINGAGWYDADYASIVYALVAHQERSQVYCCSYDFI